MKVFSKKVKEKKEIKAKMDELEMKKDLVKKREEIKSFDDLIEFLKYVKDNCNSGYGAAPKAIAQASLAVAWQLAGEFGINLSQAGFVMFDFIRDWAYRSNKSGLEIIDYDKMLYPQYEHNFQNIITNHTWNALQSEAKMMLEKYSDSVDPKLVEHWKSIADGNVPFGYSVKED